MENNYLKLNPNEDILFNPSLKDYTELLVTNQTNNSLAYKVRTNSPKVFTVSPSSGNLYPHEQAKVTIRINSAPELNSKLHKFQVLAVPSSEKVKNSIDWNSPNVQQYKLSATVEGTNRDSLHSDPRYSFSEASPGEDSKKPKQLEQEIKTLKQEIDQIQRKLQFAQEFEKYGAGQKQGISSLYLALAFVLGFFMSSGMFSRSN